MGLGVYLVLGYLDFFLSRFAAGRSGWLGRCSDFPRKVWRLLEGDRSFMALTLYYKFSTNLKFDFTNS